MEFYVAWLLKVKFNFGKEESNGIDLIYEKRLGKELSLKQSFSRRLRPLFRTFDKNIKSLSFLIDSRLLIYQVVAFNNLKYACIMFEPLTYFWCFNSPRFPWVRIWSKLFQYTSSKKISSFAFMCHIHFPPRNGLESRILTQDPINMVALMSSPFYIHR